MNDIAIVIPARNAATTLSEALCSVLAAPEVGEVIVVDDGSTDDTVDVAHEVGDPRVCVVPGPQSGVAGALNAGFAAVTCPFVARCDADDFFPRDRLAWQRARLIDHTDRIAVSGGFASVFPDGTLAAELACTGNPRDVTDALLEGRPLTHLCTWLIRTEAIGKVGGAREWFTSAEDLDLQFRLAEVGRVWHEPRVTYFYRLHDNSITHQSPSVIMKFYDTQARAFAQQRRFHGSDFLQQGTPPILPEGGKQNNTKTSALDQAIGHVISAAWHEFKTGEGNKSYRRVHVLLLRHPLSGPLWKASLILNYKMLERRLTGNRICSD